MRIVLSLILSLGFSIAQAGDLNWSGYYRAEAVSLLNPGADKSLSSKQYILHHMALKPSIVVADGIQLHSQLDFFNNPDFPGSQFGDYLGQSSKRAGVAGDSNVESQSQTGDEILVTQAYMKWATDYGSLIVGRAPIHFGLGLTHNAGAGEWDHWMDVRDMIAYKIIMGNSFFMPIYGKVHEGAIQKEDDVFDYMLHFQYENPDTDLILGAIYNLRRATAQANDIATTIGGAGSTRVGEYEAKLLNLFVSRKTEKLSFGLEASFQDINTGVETADGQAVTGDGFGLAAELYYFLNPKWDLQLKAGFASGDDPSSDSKYEGYLFDGNYDIALLLFNHVLGAADVVGTANNHNPAVVEPDTERATNVLYVAPGAKWKLNDKWNLKTQLLWATLQEAQLTGGDKDLGWELDVGLYYKPHDKVSLGFETGFLFPGGAFEGGDLNLDTSMIYGIMTKAAVSF